ncbi:MAG: hypothetical protein M1608_03730 [Candidatus Omnitrophica bacterium]|nr:hypothetical protein [Candidatus Omnitrophota bacterium]
MILHWQYLLPAALFILLPMPLPARMRLTARTRVAAATVKDMVCTWQNWADLLRAGLAVFVLLDYAITVDSTVRGAGLKALMVESLVLCLGLLLQTVRIKQTTLITAPVFYLCGLTIPLSGYLVGIFAIFVGWLFAIAGKHLQYILPVTALALGVAGFILGSLKPLLVFNCVLMLFPVVISLLFEKELLFACRAPRDRNPDASTEETPEPIILPGNRL